MRPEPLWLYRMRTSIGLQTVLMIVGTLVVTWTLVTMLDAAAGIDKHGAPLACARVGAER